MGTGAMQLAAPDSERSVPKGGVAEQPSRASK